MICTACYSNLKSMRHREISQKEIEEIIGKCEYCHIAMIDLEGMPYVLPMNFGYHDGVIYFHSAPLGKKISILKSKPDVCVEFSADCVLRFQDESVACSYSMKYKSVLAHGKIEFVEDEEQKIEVLDRVMKNYSPLEFKYSSPSVRNVACWKLKVNKFEGRVFGY